MIEYNIKPIELKADSVDELQIPDANDRVIVKSGDVVEFTMRELEDNIAKLRKFELDVQAKIDNDKAKIENIEHFNPWLKKMTEEKKHACYLYFISFLALKEFEPKLKEVKDQLALDIAEREEIIKQLPDVYGAKD